MILFPHTMHPRFLTIIGTLFLVSCVPQSTEQTRSDAGGFLPARGMEINGLPAAEATSIVTINDGDTITLNPEIVRGEIGGKNIALYAYNGQFPGPTLKVKQGSTFTVNVTNNIDVPTTIHWHGIRLDNAFDGAAGVTQEAIEPGKSFTYTVTVPDEGIFWYHPHVREDIQQDMGLYGLMHVTPKSADAYPPVDREEYVMLDDILLEGGLPVPYGREEADHALMGRFGNTILVNGTQNPSAITVQRNDVVRYYIVNAANTRTFNVSFGEAKARLLGGDAGRYEQTSELDDSLVISPSERFIVDVLYWDEKRANDISHINPTPIDGENSVGSRMNVLLNVDVSGTANSSSAADAFFLAREHVDVVEDIDAFRPFFDKPVDKTLHLSVESRMAGMVTQGNPGGMDHGMHGDSGTATQESGGIEWEDPMPHMNAMSVKGNTQWKLIDEASGAENMDIHYRFTVGDKVKIRIINDPSTPLRAGTDGSDHPMQHPIHFHGQRFLVLSIDGKPTENYVWKDTVLVPTGSSVDILLDVTNPGDWMFHCHIAEHLSNGMMGMFTVVDA